MFRSSATKLDVQNSEPYFVTVSPGSNDTRTGAIAEHTMVIVHPNFVEGKKSHECASWVTVALLEQKLTPIAIPISPCNDFCDGPINGEVVPKVVLYSPLFLTAEWQKGVQ